MGIISRTGDLFYAFRFLKLLVTPWDKMVAYELGIIDENGKVLKKKRTTPEEKAAYTVFHRLVFNIKRLLGKLPFGKTKLATYASALFLIKESTNISEDTIHEVLSEIFDDLENQKITYQNDKTIEFEIDAFRKKCLLEGLDDIGLTLQKNKKIDVHEEKIHSIQPWIV